MQNMAEYYSRMVSYINWTLQQSYELENFIPI